jgi:hypothetical protein
VTRGGRGEAGNDEGTTMSATENNGVHCAVETRRFEAADGVRDDPCQNGTQPSHDGGVGARPGDGQAENAGDDACHNGTQPSHHGGVGEGARDAAPEKSGRDALGRFAPGNQGGPGNPFERLMGMLRCALVRRIKPEQVEAIADVLIEKAKAGDVAAAKLVLSYSIGKPSEAVNPDTLDLAEWDIYRRGPVSLDDLRGIVEGIPLDVVGPVVRTAKPYLNANMFETVKNVIMPDPARKRSRKERKEERRRRRAETAAATGGDPPG